LNIFDFDVYPEKIQEDFDDEAEVEEPEWWGEEDEEE